MSVILLEASDSGQPSQCSWQLVSVQDAEICQPQRKLPPRSRPVAEHQTEETTGVQEVKLTWYIKYCIYCYSKYSMCFLNAVNLRAIHLPVPRAVHWLESKYVIFHWEGKHVFAVVLPVSRCLPQFAVIDVGGSYFLKASSPVLILEKTAKPHKQA